jgi:hypothetical protein
VYFPLRKEILPLRKEKLPQRKVFRSPALEKLERFSAEKALHFVVRRLKYLKNAIHVFL